MRRNVAYGMLLLVLEVLAFSSCRKDPQPVPGPEERIPVLWDVAEVGEMKDTKALVTDRDGLQNACRPVADGGQGKSIGVWADYSIVEGAGDPDASGAPSNGRLVTYENVFDNAEIIYTGDTSESPSGWNGVDGKGVYWAVGGDYKFRAYYPQTLADYIMESSDADVFVIDYNTVKMQEDMMVAYATVDTQTADLSAPVELEFHHTLSAVKFRFQFIDGYLEEDYLTSCWLENKAEGGLTNIGMMVYGGSDSEQISWSESYQPPVGQKIYYWKHPGIYFNRTSGTNTAAVAYMDPSDCSEGESFSRNDGWLLLIPQESDGKVQICFTTKTGGDVIYRVDIPKKTGTKADGSTSGTDEELVYFAPSHRYTYTVNIGKTNLELKISLSKWNQLDSSYSITF